jgi:energy-coupling factor transporter ATP-binding protein EcfA2
MIHALEIENLKSLAGRHKIPLAPITLIYGANSAGKSTMLQALAVLKQTLEPSAAPLNTAHHPLSLRGELVDLGSFAAAISGHDLKRRLGLGVTFSSPSTRAGIRPRMRTGATGQVRLTFRYDRKAGLVRQHDVTLGVDHQCVRYVPSGPPASQQDLFSSADGFFRVASAKGGQALLALVRDMLPARSVGARLAEELEQFLAYDPTPTFLGRGFFPVSPSMRAWRTQSKRHQSPELPSAVLAGRLSDAVFGPASALGDLLSELAYLGPLRAAPTRLQARTGAVFTNVGARGEHTQLLLLDNPRLLASANAWLHTLGIHYQLEIAPLEATSIGPEIGDLVVTRLIDTRSELAVTPQDVGFGISQLLPVVIQALAGQGRTICVEQPEIHIHPRLQTELADLFIAAAEQNRNQLIIETHSEHLMLRFARRLREQQDGGWLTPDKLCVLYMDQDVDGNTIPIQLRLNEEGEFLDAWPNGFFTERIGELFPAGDRPRRRVVRRTQSDTSR